MYSAAAPATAYLETTVPPLNAVPMPVAAPTIAHPPAPSSTVSTTTTLAPAYGYGGFPSQSHTQLKIPTRSTAASQVHIYGGPLNSETQCFHPAISKPTQREVKNSHNTPRGSVFTQRDVDGLLNLLGVRESPKFCCCNGKSGIFPTLPCH